MYRPQGLNIFIYNRKSRKDRDEERKALEEGRNYDVLIRHRNRLLEVAKNEKHNIIEIFEEPDAISGELIIERPEIQKMLKRIEAGEIDALLAVDLDRVGRGDMFDMGMIYRTLKYSETLFITPTEVIDPNDDSAELYFGIKSMFSHEELKTINKRLQNGRKDSAKEGKHIAKKPPFGYLRDDKLKLYPDPEKAKYVKMIFELTVKGYGRKEIATLLDKEISPPNGGDYWDVSTITEILKNEVYLGHIIWGKIKYIKRADGGYNRKKLPREKWNIKQDAHEPLITQELFDEANIAAKSRYRSPKHTNKQLINPLSGFLKCSVCGRSMRFQKKYNRPNHMVRCFYEGCKGKQKGSILPIIEERILDGLKEIVESFEVKKDMVPKNVSHTESILQFKKKSLDNKNNELEEAHNQKNRLHDLLEKGVYDIDTFMERQQLLVSRIKDLENVVHNLKEEIEQEQHRLKNQKEFIPRIKTVLEAYHSTEDIEKKNRLLKSVIEKAVYFRDPTWKKKDHFEIQIYPRI